MVKKKSYYKPHIVVDSSQQYRKCTTYWKRGKLKPAFEELDERYDYGLLKCVLAAM